MLNMQCKLVYESKVLNMQCVELVYESKVLNMQCKLVYESKVLNMQCLFMRVKC